MSEYSIVEDPPAKLWDSLLQKFPQGNFEQCFEYGEISKIAFPKTNVARLAVTCGEEPIAVVQGTYSKYLRLGMTLRVMRGPLVAVEKEEASRLVENLLKALQNYAKKKHIIQAQVLVPEAWQFDRAFHHLGYSSTGEINEYTVNVERSVDAVWRSISHNKRGNIKKAADEGVEFFESHKQEDLPTFYAMLEAAEKRKGFSSYPLSWFKSVWKVYKPELSRVFFARWKRKNVSGVFTLIHGKTVYALAAGSFSEGWKVRANDMVHWKAMEWASQNGYSRYHMGMVSEPPPTENSSTWGIWRWKREWNGNLDRIRIFDKMLLPRYKLIIKAKKVFGSGYVRLKQSL
jgi:hypothetical protein